MPKCVLCGKEFSDDDLFEGVLCYGCKAKQDQLTRGGELKVYEEDMLLYNHHGETCWLRGTLCQEGWCSGCQIYLDWKESLKGVRAR